MSTQERPAPAMNHSWAAEEIVVCAAAEGGKHVMQSLAFRRREGTAGRAGCCPKELHSNYTSAKDLLFDTSHIT